MGRTNIVLAAGLSGLLLASPAQAEGPFSKVLKRAKEAVGAASDTVDSATDSVSSASDTSSERSDTAAWGSRAGDDDAKFSGGADPKFVEKVSNDAYTARRVVEYGVDNEFPDKQSTLMASFLMKSIQGCLDGIAELQQSAPKAQLRINGVGLTSLSTAKTKFCEPALAAIEPHANAAFAAEAAKYKGLSEKRIAVIKRYGLDLGSIKGPGKAAFASNAALQKAPCWFYHNREKTLTGYPWWRIAKFCFDATDGYQITNTSGDGIEAPASAYR